jgi:drug/metabolite transporter (DMT)-like permease
MTGDLRNGVRGLVNIHSAVLLFGVAGLFGKLLVLPPIVIVFGRVFFSGLFLFALIKIKKYGFRLSRKSDFVLLGVMGIILSIHWITFFMSIQMTTVAIGLITFSTFPVFVTFLEPYFFREKLIMQDMIISLAAFGGVAVILPNFDFNNRYVAGTLIGVCSGISYAFLALMNKKYVKEYPAAVISFYQQAVSVIILLPCLFFYKPNPEPNDIFLLLVLGVVFTGISHKMFIDGLKYVKARVAAVISNLEPVYGIIFAAFLLNEMPTGREITGGIIILGTVVYLTSKGDY